MENGQLVSSEVLPKVAKELKKSALAGGAFEKALKGLQVTQGQLITQSQRMADTIFSNGFAEGLSELYKTLSKDMQSTGKSQKDLGNIYKNVFKFIAKAMKVITPLIEATIQVVSKLTDVLMLSAKGWKMLYDGLPDNLKSVAVGVTAIGLAFKSTIAKAAIVISMFQEIASLFDDKLVGALEIKLGSQFNLGNMTQQALRKDDKTGKYYAQGETKDLLENNVGKMVAVGAGLTTLALAVSTLSTVVGTLSGSVAAMSGGTNGRRRNSKFTIVNATMLVSAAAIGIEIGSFLENYVPDVFKSDLGRGLVAIDALLTGDKEAISTLNTPTEVMGHSEPFKKAKKLGLPISASGDSIKEYRDNIARSFDVIGLMFGSKSSREDLDKEAFQGGYTPKFQTMVDKGLLGEDYPTTKDKAQFPNVQSQIDNGFFGGRYSSTDQLLYQSKLGLSAPTGHPITVEGFEINVNLADGNLQQAQQAGSMLGASFIEKLNSGLSAAIKGGR